MSLLNLYSTPADRIRKCVFAERFEGAANLAKNGGTIGGSATWVSNGLHFNNVSAQVIYSVLPFGGAPWVSFCGVFEFTPEFSYTDGVRHNFIGVAGGASNIYKHDGANSNKLRVIVGTGSTVIDATTAEYGPYWRDNQRNILAWSCVSGSNFLYLNGNLVKTSASSWTPSIPNASVIVGGSGGLGFVGTVHSAKLFTSSTAAQALTAKDCEVLSAGTTYNYWDSGVTCIMDGLAANYDPVNYRHLDLSGKGNHVLLGNGAGTGTPTKLSTQGYSFAGSQYMTVPLAAWPGSAGTFLLDVCANTNSGSLRLWGTDHTGGSFYEVLSSASGTNNRVIMGNGAGQTACNVGPDKRWSKIIVGVTWLSGSFVRGYTDGLFAMSSAINANTPYTPDTAWWLMRYDIYSPGIVRSFVAFNRELSSLQIADVTLWMKKLRTRV